jgi:carbamoyltransferase
LNILGISAYYHDSAAALLVDGELVAAAQEERFSRLKFDPGLPVQAIEYCLREAGLTKADLDYVVFYEKPLRKFHRILLSNLVGFPRSLGSFRESLASWFTEKMWVKSDLLKLMEIPEKKLLFVEHHLSHAASAFFSSPYENAAVLSLDGVGEWTTSALGTATGSFAEAGQNSLRLTEEIRFPHSLGLLYSAFTAWLGFEVNEGEYKVMGMAPYGRPTFVDKVRQVIRVDNDGSFELDMRYFAFHRSATRSYSAKFVKLFGPPRQPGSEFAVGDRQSLHFADVAASLQLVVEETILAIAEKLHKDTGMDNLVMAGGVALNSKANGRLMAEGPFQSVFIQPNPGDAGGALGAALYVWHIILGMPRKHRMDHAYYGERYPEARAKSAMEAADLVVEEVDEDHLVQRTVEALLKGEVVALAQGRFEWGPRALGNRSILADPRKEAMKDLVNTKIKFREPFRPFAPVVLEKYASKYFEVNGLEKQHPARFMQMVCPVRMDMADQIPAVNHHGTSRIQTIKPEWNPLYAALLASFGQATGVPILMNTSFNLRGEPIVSSPEDACKTFLASGIDLLVIPPFLARK